MKCRVDGGRDGCADASPPSRGAWIEILKCFDAKEPSNSSPPSRGAWIEIHWSTGFRITSCRRPPRGGRGLKSGQ